MRVIAGSLGGRSFEAPRGNRTHPMSDRVRTALFNKLNNISGKTVLDAYAGSGALSFESVSRGAEYVQAIDRDKKAFDVMQRNKALLQIGDELKVTRANCVSWLDNNSSKKFDLILLDPPYSEVNLSTISKFVKHLNDEGLMVLSHSGREATPTVNGVVVVDNRIYGDAALSYYRLDK